MESLPPSATNRKPPGGRTHLSPRLTYLTLVLRLGAGGGAQEQEDTAAGRRQGGQGAAQHEWGAVTEGLRGPARQGGADRVAAQEHQGVQAHHAAAHVGGDG